jgi:hypothetical protein
MADPIASLATRPRDPHAANCQASRGLVTPRRPRGFFDEAPGVLVITEPAESAAIGSAGTEPDGSSGTEQAK